MYGEGPLLRGKNGISPRSFRVQDTQNSHLRRGGGSTEVSGHPPVGSPVVVGPRVSGRQRHRGLLDTVVRGVETRNLRVPTDPETDPPHSPSLIDPDLGGTNESSTPSRFGVCTVRVDCRRRPDVSPAPGPGRTQSGPLSSHIEVLGPTHSDASGVPTRTTEALRRETQRPLYPLPRPRRGEPLS